MVMPFSSLALQNYTILPKPPKIFTPIYEKNVKCQYQSIMIEVNKRLYMDELTLEKTARFDKLRGEMQALYVQLLE